MKILLSNKYYYNRGGDCIASMAVEKLLKEKGHDVAFFSMQHPLNIASPWEEYFPSEVDFNKGSVYNKIQAAQRLFYPSDVKQRFIKLLNQFKPDVVHLNNIHSQLSPYIGEIAHKKGIKVIWTLHDFKLICPSYSCLRNGKSCELCLPNKPFSVLKHKCMKNSYPASLLAYLEAKIWNLNKLIKQTDYFVTPSRFMAEKFIQANIPSSKIEVIPNFFNRPLLLNNELKEDYYCYIGRLSKEKGIETLIEVSKNLPYKLIVIGSGLLENMFKDKYNHIKFVGFKEWDEIVPIINKARFIVIPSECYEVFGLVSIEAQSLGTPVLASNIGGLPETINSKSGMLFEAGNKDDLRNKIQKMFQTEFVYNEIKEIARERFSAENYYNKIIKIYEQ